MPEKRPNILFLFSDQFNARFLSCAEHPNVKTPNLDFLAKRGMRFENAFAQSPICTPSRMCFLSGLYASTHGYHGLYGREPDSHLTSQFRFFREAGYRTGAIGKLHTPRYWIERDCQFIYDEFIEYPKYLEGAGFYDVNDNRRFTGWKDGQPSSIPLEHSCEVVTAKQAIRFINNQGEPSDRGDPSAPWFAWASFSRPHSPLTPSEPYASMYPVGSFKLPPSASPEAIAMQPERIRQVPRTHKAPEPHEVETMVSTYLGLVSQVDYGVGIILKELERQNLMEDTVIIFSADHGDYGGEHGLWSKIGGISSRAITRIPMILSFPQKIPSGSVCDEIVESIDLFPTLCELTDLPIPDHLQGRSMTPLMGDDPKPIRDSALTENAYSKAITTKDWRYVANAGGQPDALYHQVEDPWEIYNLINDPQHSQVAQDMLRKLLSRVAYARRPVTMFEHGSWKHPYDRDGRVADPLTYTTRDTHV